MGTRYAGNLKVGREKDGWQPARHRKRVEWGRFNGM